MFVKQWRRELGLLPALAWMVGCGGVAGPEETGSAPPAEVREAEARAVTADCKPVTYYSYEDISVTYDTYVAQDSPTSRYDTSTKLVSDGSPRQDVYLRFDYGDFGPIVGAKLRLYATDGSTNGPVLYTTSANWTSLTWNTRPAPTGAALGNVGEVTSGSWVEYDVTGKVGGSGTYGFVLIPEGGNGVDFVSSNDVRYELRPHLLLKKAHTVCSYQGTGGQLGPVWQKGGAGGEEVHALATDSGSGAFVIAGGYTGSASLGGATFPTPGGLMLGRFRADGSHEWSRAYPQANATLDVTGITLTPLGNVLMVGHYLGTPDFGTGPLPTASGYAYGTFIAKFSPSGRITWVKGFTARNVHADGDVDPESIMPWAVATDANGSLIVTGTFFGETNLGGGRLFAGDFSRASEDANPGLFIAKFSWEGNHLWSHALEAGSSPTAGRALATDSAGNVLLGGVVSRPNPLATGPEDPLIAKFSPTGNLLWTRVLHGAIGEVRGVAVLPGDAVAFGGHFSRSFTFAGQTLTGSEADEYEGNPDLMLGVLESSGADRQARRYGDTPVDYLTRLVADPRGNLVVMGWTSGGSGVGGGPIGSPVGGNGFVASYTATGAHRWSRALDVASVLGVTPDGSTLVGGSFSGTVQVEGTQYGPARNRDVLMLKLLP